MKILIADKFEQSGLNGLAKLGVDVDYQPELKGESLELALKEGHQEILIVRSTEVTAPILESSKLGLVIRAGAGYNTIDVKFASDKGIRVTNCPGKNSQAVAELAFGLIISCDRKIPDNVSELRAGVWNKKRFSQAQGLYGKTLGLVGMGKISQEMIARAKGFGMNVAAYSRWMTPETAAALGIGRADTIVELAQLSDVISVHVSLTSETRGFLDRKFFDAMKHGAIFVNTSRGEVVNQMDMLSALESKGIMAGLDVFDGEPTSGEGTYNGPLRDHPNVYCTHHIGASTNQAQEAVADEVVKIVREYLLSGTVINVINVSKREQANFLLIVRHADRVGVLASVFAVLRDESINVEDMENVVLGGARAAIAQIAIDKEPDHSALQKIKMNPNIFDATIMAIQK